MFTTTTHPHPDDDTRDVIVAITNKRGLSRYSWTWTGGTQIGIADRAADTPFDTVGVYDHGTGRIVIYDTATFVAFLTARYANESEIDALEATWQASLY